MKQSVGCCFFVLVSCSLFEMSAACLRGQEHSASQLSLLQTHAHKMLLLCDACRPSALLLAGEQQVAALPGKDGAKRCEQGHPAWLLQAKARGM